MSWAAALKDIVDDKNVKELYKSEEAIEKEYFKELMGYNIGNIKNNYKIPQFFFKVYILFNLFLNNAIFKKLIKKFQFIKTIINY